MQPSYSWILMLIVLRPIRHLTLSREEACKRSPLSGFSPLRSQPQA